MNKNGIGNIEGKPLRLKIDNRKKIFNLFRQNRSLSAVEISSLINLSRTTTSKNISFLMKNGFIKKNGKGISTNEGGKKPDLYILDENYKYAVSVLILPFVLECAVFNLNNKRSFHVKYDIPHNESFEKILEYIVSYIKNTISKIGEKDLIGIGIGCDGIIDYENGVIRMATHFPSWGVNIEMQKILLKSVGINTKIFVDNSIRLLALSEDIENKYDIVTMCHEELGFSGCYIKKGRIERGVNSFIGEIGHTIVNPYDTVICDCGARGCFERSVDIMRLIERAKGSSIYKEIEHYKKMGDAAKKIFVLSNEGNDVARSIMDDIISWFAVIVHNIIIFYDPNLIIIQGIYAGAGNYFITRLREKVQSSVFPMLKKETKIEYSKNNYRDNILSAPARHVIDLYFSQEYLYI